MRKGTSTEEILRQGRTVCAAATGGPWTDRDEPPVVYAWLDHPDPNHAKYAVVSRCTGFAFGEVVGAFATKEDAEFARAARTLLPQALDALEEATRRAEKAEAVIRREEDL